MLYLLRSISRKSRPKADQSNPIPDQSNPITDWQMLYCFLYKASTWIFCLSWYYNDRFSLSEKCNYSNAYAYSEICQTSKMERFVKVINSLNPWAIFAKHSILNIDRVLNMPLNVVKFLLLTWNYYYCLYYSLIAT